MLYFVISLVVGVLAVLAAQKADIECVNARTQVPAPWTPAPKTARRGEDRGRRVALVEAAQH